MPEEKENPKSKRRNLKSDLFAYFVYSLFTLTAMEYKFINTEYLDSVSGGDTEVIRELVDMFREQAVEIYDEMKTHYSSGNYLSLGMLAHKAKSSVAIMGMNDLATMLKSFELQAKEGKGSELYEAYIQRYKSETDAALTELEDVIKKRIQ